MEFPIEEAVGGVLVFAEYCREDGDSVQAGGDPGVDQLCECRHEVGEVPDGVGGS